jgi:hypothetical protein
MDLYIQVENGQPIGHPAYGFNLIQAFTLIPANWEKFERKERPAISIYQKFESIEPKYEKIDGVWQDVWAVVDFSEEEKTAMQQQAKDEWTNRRQAANWAAWIFDEDTCSFIPPIPRPEPIEGKIVVWCGAESNWKETPVRPQDGKKYQFDFFAWTWTEITENQ